jgi:hypothetical protein
MFDGLTLTFISDASAWAVTAAVVLYVFRLVYMGKLVPGRTVEMDRRALAAERETNAELRAALLEYQAIGSTTIHLLKSIQRDREEGEDG